VPLCGGTAPPPLVPHSDENRCISPEERLALEKLQMIIERAILDGRITADELNQTNTRITADGSVLFVKIELCRQLVWNKIQNGEIMVMFQMCGWLLWEGR